MFMINNEKFFTITEVANLCSKQYRTVRNRVRYNKELESTIRR